MSKKLKPETVKKRITRANAKVDEAKKEARITIASIRDRCPHEWTDRREYGDSWNECRICGLEHGRDRGMGRP